MARCSRTALAAIVLATASAAAPPEEVERLGRTLVRYRGPEVEVVLSYRFAAANPAEPWLLLLLAVTGTTGKATEIPREKIFLLTPDGRRVDLPSQREFAAAAGGLRGMLARASINQEPVDYWSGRSARPLQLFAMPGEGLAFDAMTVDNRTVAIGPLFFPLPGGAQEGTYRLGMDVQESRVRIPFELGQRR